METLGHLAHGFSVAFTPVTLIRKCSINAGIASASHPQGEASANTA